MNLNKMPDSDDMNLQSDLDSGNWSYEETVKLIETTIARIESGELDLASVFDEFAEAVKNLQQCETFLAERQQQVELLIETLRDDPEF